MNNAEYLKQNELGFEGDTILRDTTEKLIKDNKITWIIETGTFRGATTRHFADWVQKVDTIEVDPNNYQIAKGALQNKDNVTIHHGSSDMVLEEIFKAFDKKGRRPNLFLFLDAHWQEHNPLLNELKLIAKYKWKPVIMIHDFKVPGRPDLGYDQYGDITYEWEWIKHSIERIYGKDGFDFEYNAEATGAKRGVIIIKKK